MTSNKLSAVLEKKIRRLCLNDFPCGYGSWRKTKDSAAGADSESTHSLLDLLSCHHSPWRYDDSWSPQASALRKLAVLTPQHLHTNFIYSYFTTLRIVDKGVSDVDDGLLKFSKLEELVLSANQISEIQAENLPSSLKILELRANRLSSLNSFTGRLPPCLQYLGLSHNSLGSREDISHLTGRHWPQLVCLDLSDCDFQDQRSLLEALSSLPRLKTLVLEGNPFTLAPSYPGFTVDHLPGLSCLDALWISPEQRHRFRGLAEMSELIADTASATVNVGRVRGIPDPLMSVEENAPDFPVVSFSYFITYEFLSHETPGDLNLDSEAKFDTASTAHVIEDGSCDTDLISSRKCKREMSEPDTEAFVVNTEDACSDAMRVSGHSTSKLTWSECMDFSDAQTYVVSSLGDLKKFLNQGLYLRLEEEKVLSWPAASEDAPVTKNSQTVKEKQGGKGKESPVKSGSTKDKKKKCVPELVQDAPIRRILGSAHVPLQSLVKGGQKVNVICDLGVLHSDSKVEAPQTPQKDLGKKNKEDKKKEEKESKRREGKGKGKKKPELDVHTDDSVSVEVSVELEKWKSASEAHQLVLPR
ncbi:leucine-rich repeat-containing protein 43 isoform X2 [Acanthochromis polyacanthus]|uniref:leucine-rich repeat-containing protein 43 isoform X2 n=1 Tax=Acanthochromis polyacanthus TaxID=80966 RepID=UPI002233F05E|nr:leucine-rich repeat-containing protein 43 isoform X2 [Acanthochromis polyacanthus]